MADALQQPLRFIKKIPNSAAAPSFKLTLPHQVVQRHLQHLIGQSFELASSSGSTQTWEASLSSRRNKMRAEYVLQGWKLFAEAHSLQAGDQASFELVGKNKLVVKVIQPASAQKITPLVRSSPDSPNASVMQPLKSFKTSGSLSPSRVNHADPHAVSINWLQDHESSIAQEARMKCLSSPPALSHHVEALPMAHRVQSWLSHNIPTPHSSAPVSESTLLPRDRERYASHPFSQSASPKHPIASDESLSKLLQSDLPGIFDDMSHSLDSVVPDLPPSSNYGFEDDPQLDSLCSFLEVNVNRDTQPTLKAEEQPCESELRALVSTIQDRLDHSTRSALQAAMGLETCVMDIVNPSGQINARDMQAKMFQLLSALKESLWQVLVVANNPDE